MKAQMTHWERVRAALKGEETDRVPISMWRHFFDRETLADTLAEATIAYQQRFDWDFIKVNPRASYHVEDWGVRTVYHGAQSPEVTERPIARPDDWLKLKPLALDRGVLKEHVDLLDVIGRGLKGTVPFIMTVFTPMAIAGRMTPTEDTFVQHLREHPDKVQTALDVITETFTAFGRACLEHGAAGLFYATTAFATADPLTLDEYQRLARPYDLKLLNALPPADFHVLHVCRERNFLPALADYPVHAFNWDARGAGNLSLAEGKALVGQRAVIGGISHQQGLVKASPEQLKGEVAGLKVAMGRRGWMLGPGCTFPPETPEANLRAVRDAA